MEKLFRLISIIGILITATLPLGSEVHSYSYNGIHWDTNSVDYDLAGVDPSWRSVIVQAADTWNSTGANFSFNQNTGNSEHDWSVGYINTPGRIAETAYYYNVNTLHISDCDTVFNQNETFNNGGGGNAYDIQTVALHEFGHWLSLNDLSWFWDSSKVMYGTATHDVKTTLHQDDINGILNIYTYPPVAPTVSTNNANNVTSNSATVNGNLVSLGTASTVTLFFDWGPTQNLGSSVQGTPSSTTSPTAFSANLTGLTPGTTYYFRARAEGDGTCVTSNLQFTTNPSSYTIAASAGSGGSISPSGSVSVSPGGSASFSITADSGFTISNVYVDGNPIGPVSSYTFNNVFANHSINADFAQNPVYYYLSVSNDGNGYTYGSGNYASNTYAAAVAYPIAPYYFWCWNTDTGTYYSSYINIYMDANHWAYAQFLPPW